MTWKEFKNFCAKYQLSLGWNSIRFSQIPATKKYFERRPKWDVFEFIGDMQKSDGSSLQNLDRYVWTSTGRRSTKAPIFFYRPPSLTGLNTYTLEDFLVKGKIPQSFFRRWSSKPVPIYTVEDLENAYKELLDYLETCKRLQESADLKNYTNEYKKKQAEIEQLQKDLIDIKKKYKQSFCKQAGIADDF